MNWWRRKRAKEPEIPPEGRLVADGVWEKILPALWDLRAHYYERGSSDGEAIVFVHGYQSDARIWWPVLTRLPDQVRAIALDLPGHGKSGKPFTTYTIPFYGRFLAHFLARLQGGSPATLVGVSLGGAIVAYTALLVPERVNRLVIVDGLGMGRTPPWRQVRLFSHFLPLVIHQAMGKPSRYETYRFWQEVLFADPSRVTDPMISEALEAQRQSRLASLLTGLALSLPSAHLYPQLHRLRPPTLLIWGVNDRLFPPHHGEEAAGRIPAAHLTVIPRAGHLPMLEQTEAFLAVLNEFLHQSAPAPIRTGLAPDPGIGPGRGAGEGRPA